MDSIDDYARQIQLLSSGILDSRTPEKKFVLVRRQAYWESVHNPDDVAVLEDLRLAASLGGLVISRALRYTTTRQLTARLFSLESDGHIGKIITNVEDMGSIAGNIKHAQHFAPNIYDYRQATEELEYGLALQSQ